MGDVDGARQCFDRAGGILRQLRGPTQGDEKPQSLDDTKFVLAAPVV
jgi:hypothetical protein